MIYVLQQTGSIYVLQQTGATLTESAALAFFTFFALSPHMAAVASLSEKPVTTSTKELQSSGDSRPAVSRYVQTLVKEVLAWQRRIDNRRIPKRHSRDVEERSLGNRFANVLLRRDKAVG